MLLENQHHARRVGEIIRILGKYGLADWLSPLDYDWLDKHLISAEGEALHGLPRSRRIRLVLTELGTSFIKIGQIMSTRPDLVGTELAAELSQLQASAPANDFAEVVTTIEEEFGQGPDALFASLEPVPIASASIAQVHSAVLKNGERVVVKIMRRGIEEMVSRDLEIFVRFAALAEKHVSRLAQYQPAATARNFQRTVLRELDFSYELRHLEQFTHSFLGDNQVKFPRPHPTLSSRRVLTMELLDGIPVSDVERLHGEDIDLDDFARRAANVYLEMIFRDGFYHADPHPGNLMLLPGGTFGVLDCGMVGRIDNTLREEIENMLLAALRRDDEALTAAVVRLGDVPSSLDRQALRAEICDLLEDYVSQNIRDINLGKALDRLLCLIHEYQILLPASFALFIKTVALLEGTLQRFASDFSLAEVLEVYYARSMQRQFSPGRLFGEMRREEQDWRQLFRLFPRDIVELLRRVNRDRYEVHLEQRQLRDSIDRLTLGLLAAALFVGSATLLSHSVPPLVGELSLWGLASSLLSLYLGFRAARAGQRATAKGQSGQRR